MMATTHALAGLALGALVAWVAPAHAPAALLAGLAGGAFPDLDLYAGHRKTLHFPSYYPLAALPATVLAAAAAHPLATAAAVFLAAAGLHSAMDVLGGGLELRPWRGTSDRAVFDHRRGVWLVPRRWVPYDGAPADVALAVAVGAPLLVVLGGPWPPVVASVLALSVGYALLRRPLVRLTERLVRLTPARALPYVPDRFLDGFEPAADARSRTADVTARRDRPTRAPRSRPAARGGALPSKRCGR